MLIEDQFGIIQYLMKSPISQTSLLTGTFFATSYSKAALDFASKTVFRNGLIGQKPKKRMHWVIKN